MIRILYAEDDAMTARLCVDYMTDKGFRVYHVSDGESALRTYKSEKPDVILLDVKMPKKDGFEVAKTIREEDMDTPILFISSLTDTKDVIQGLDMGGCDYIRKETLLEEVEARMHAVLRLAKRHEPEVCFIKIAEGITLDTVSRRLTRYKEAIRLTPIEMRIMKTLCVNKNHYVSKEHLVEVGWSNAYKESFRYLDKVIVRLRKFFPKGGTVEIATSWGKGLGLMCKGEEERDNLE